MPARTTTRRVARSSQVLRHLGPFGLFVLAIVDSSPIPTFGGLDILLVILAARRAEPWYYYAAAATAGSVIGAYLTFRVARGAGKDYLERKFGARRVGAILRYFEKWGTGALVFTTFTPVPLPTVTFFAAAGVLDYPARRFVTVVALARAARYSALAAAAAHFGRRVIPVIRHPMQHVSWMLLVACLVIVVAAATLLVQKRKSEKEESGVSPFAEGQESEGE